MYFDGFKCTYGVYASVILISPSNDVIRMVYKHGFNCINNIEKYEVFILEHKAIVFLNIKSLNIYSDS